jgi:RNA polymerase sigma-70 factor, ECF subfamily
MKTDQMDVTQILKEWSDGDPSALDKLVPIVYSELRRIARHQLRRETVGHTLQPTGLVNELYLRLVEQRRATWTNRAHFYAVAAQLMRRILVDHARRAIAAKRGGVAPMVSLVEAESVEAAATWEVLAVDEALQRLATIDREQARIVELRFFSGLSVEETAHVLARSPRTITREWRLAKAWLYRELRHTAH